MVTYATRQDFYTFGLPAAACVPDSRSLASVDASSSTFELPGHGFVESDVLRFVALGAGAALPAGLSAGLLYGAFPIGSDLFQATWNGAPVTITTSGAGVIAVVEEIGPKIDRILEARSSYVDANAIAYTPPFRAPFPPWAVQIVCKLAALDVALTLRRSIPGYNLDEVRKEADRAEAFLARLAEGKPTADNPADQTHAIAEAGARGWKRESRGWDGGGVL